MKKIIYILLVQAVFIFSGFSLEAMPPHPDLLEKWRSEGVLETNLESLQSQQIFAVQKSVDANRSSSLSSGTVKFPVILVSYSGTAVSKTAVFFNELLNGVADTDLSVKKYYRDMSNGSLTVVLDVYGPVTVAGTLSYYGSNTGGAGTDAHRGELAYDAISAAAGSIDFSRYDNNRDGYVDCVIIIHAGAGEEVGGAADTIWSHQWDLASAKALNDGGGIITDDGKKISVYTMQYEADTGGNSTVGVFCHELGHVFGLPDLYDTSNVTNGVGDWSLMGSGSWGSGNDGKDPSPLLAWERRRVGGSSWIRYADINPVYIKKPHSWDMPGYLVIAALAVLVCLLFVVFKPGFSRSAAAPASALILAVAVSCSVEPATIKDEFSIDDIESGHEAYRFSLSGMQYLILEGKTAADTTGWFVPGTGILVTHIDEDIISSYPNSVNAGSARVHGVNIVEADGSDDLWDNSDSGTASDLYYSPNKTSLTSSTSPNTKYYTDVNISSKTGDSGVSIKSVSTNSFPMTFKAEY